MAQYDFTCRSCDQTFEVFSTGFINDEQRHCPHCGSRDVQQRYSSFLHSIKAAPTPAAACACAAAPQGCGCPGCD